MTVVNFMERNYHIYYQNSCIHFSLTEEEFQKIWNSLENKHQYTYEEVLHPRDVWAGIY